MKDTVDEVLERLAMREKALIGMKQIDLEYLPKLREQIQDLQGVLLEHKNRFFGTDAKIYNESLQRKKDFLKEREDQIKEIDMRLDEILIFKKYINWAKPKSTLDIHVYDVLVFENASGDIYQDCVCSIEKENVYGVKTARCNNTTVYYNTEKFLSSTCVKDDSIKFRGNLKEVWSRSDDNTYTKVWSME